MTTVPTLTPTATTTSAVTTTAGSTVVATIPARLEAFGTETVTVGDEEWFVAVADTAGLRFRGLRRIADLGALDGMIFIWNRQIETSFTMRTVPIPLDIGFFDAAGELLEVVNMFPCGDSDDCPLYAASGPFQFAIERAVGGWDGVPMGALLGREN